MSQGRRSFGRLSPSHSSRSRPRLSCSLQPAAPSRRGPCGASARTSISRRARSGPRRRPHDGRIFRYPARDGIERRDGEGVTSSRPRERRIGGLPPRRQRDSPPRTRVRARPWRSVARRTARGGRPGWRACGHWPDHGIGRGRQHRASATEVAVYVARGLAVIASPGGRVEVNAGERGVTNAVASPSVTPVAFWHDWTGGMGDQHGAVRRQRRPAISTASIPTGRAGAPARPLAISQQVVRAVIRDGLAETEVDQTFATPGASRRGLVLVHRSCGGERDVLRARDGRVLVEGEVIERREAAARYAAAVRAAHDPALLEWIDGRTYRARDLPDPRGRLAARRAPLPRDLAGRRRKDSLRVPAAVRRAGALSKSSRFRVDFGVTKVRN